MGRGDGRQPSSAQPGESRRYPGALVLDAGRAFAATFMNLTFPMNTRTLLSCLALALLSPVALTAAEARAAVAKPTQSAATLAGDYAGKWKGENEAGGNVRLTLKQTDGKWAAEAVFSYEGTDIPTTTKSLKVDGNAIELVIAWEVQGVSSTSTLKGELKGDTIAGKYDSATAESAATGTWSAKRK
jgi:hypothetical protein